MRPSSLPRLFGALLLLILSDASRAGRPLTTDDAGVAEAGSCQIESWLEHQPGTPGPRQPQGFVLAPACGLAPGWELGYAYGRQRQLDEPARSQSSFGIKYAPSHWRGQGALGEWHAGLRLSSNHEQSSTQNWQQTQYGLVSLLSLAISPSWTLHANLGLIRQREAPRSAASMNLAAVWSPSEQGFLFLEMQANDQHRAIGPNSYALGGRWWLKKEVLGLDLGASRDDQAGSRVLWTLGLSWYGLKF